MNREQKALRIAELERWKKYIHSNYHKEDIYKNNKGVLRLKSNLVDLYSSFNGLMEIVFRKKGFQLNVYENTICVALPNEIKTIKYEEGNEIDALQDAVLYYLYYLEQVKKWKW